MLTIDRLKTIEVKIDAQNQQTEFGQSASYNMIEEGLCNAIVAYPVSKLTKSKTNRPVCNANAFNQAYLTIACGSTNVIEDIPLSQLIPTAENPYPKLLKPLKINFSNCKIFVPDAATLVVGESFVFSFLYSPGR